MTWVVGENECFITVLKRKRHPGSNGKYQGQKGAEGAREKQGPVPLSWIWWERMGGAR